MTALRSDKLLQLFSREPYKHVIILCALNDSVFKDLIAVMQIGSSKTLSYLSHHALLVACRFDGMGRAVGLA